MSTIMTFPITANRTGPLIGSFTISNSPYNYDLDESYMTDGVLIHGVAKQNETTSSYKYTYTVRQPLPVTQGVRRCLYLYDTPAPASKWSITLRWYDSDHDKFWFDGYSTSNYEFPVYWTAQGLVVDYNATFSTNVPIFNNWNDARAYMTASSASARRAALAKAINNETVKRVTLFSGSKLIALRRRLIKEVSGSLDYSQFFNYTIQDGYAWVTSVKRDEWLAYFGNLDIYVPDTLEGYPTVIRAQYPS